MSPVSGEPGEGAFDNPAFGQDYKALQAHRTKDGLQHPAKRTFHLIGKAVAAVGAVAEYHF